MTLSNFLKNLFLVIIILQIAPSLLRGIYKQYSQHFEPHIQVGLIEIQGVLQDSTYHTKQLTKFFKDPEIKAILLKIDCRGSAAGTGYAIFNEIEQLKLEYPKPVIALVENICTSGGYWIACAADHVIAPSVAIIGSIGVSFQHLFELPEFLAQYKIGYNTITAGHYKSVGDPFTTMTPEEKALLQTVLDDSYQAFTQAVAHKRTLQLDTINIWADGKIFSGQQAKQLGLIDEIGSLHNATKAITERIPTTGKIKWIKPPATGGILNSLFGISENNDNSITNALLTSLCSFIENRYASKVTT